MTKYPRLAMLRAQRERQEAEIAAPYLKSMMRAKQEATAERHAREGLERIMASKVAGPMLDHLSRAMAEGAQHHIMEQVRKIYPKDGVVQLEFLAHELCWGDPDTIGSRVLAEYKRQCGPQMRFYALARIEDAAARRSTVQVSIPELHYRHALMDEKIW